MSGGVILPIEDQDYIKSNLQSDIHLSGQYL